MSTAALTSLRDYLTGTLSSSDMIWLIKEMKDFMLSSEEKLEPYTKEELHARIALGEADIAAGRLTSHEDMMREWEEELARDEKLAKAI